jgi:UDP-3-O-[3-hydroxymyristoyl] glucosamine N-acyltransferase
MEVSVPTIGEITAFLRSENSFFQFAEAADKAIIRRPAPIMEAVPGEISFCGATARNPHGLLDGTRASLLLIDHNIAFDKKKLAEAGMLAVIVRDNARLDFMRVVQKFFVFPRPHGIHPTAVISPAAHIAANVSIGPLCSIGAAEIGVGTILHAGVHIYDRVRIGRNVTIHSGTVIGADGFGYERNEQGELERFPHVGGVVVEDNVEIGANTCIDRGSLGDTYICTGSRIDNLVHIAHNVYVGKHAAVIAKTMVGGGTHIGDGTWVAPGACVRDRIFIGDRVTVGLGALVTKDVPDRATVLGSPAREIDEYKRLLSVLHELLKV